MENESNIKSDIEGAQKRKLAEYTKKLKNKWSSLTPQKKVYFSSLGILAAASTLDVATTGIGLQLVGPSGEINPLVRTVMQIGGFEAVALFRAGATVGLVTAYEIMKRRDENVNLPMMNMGLRFVNIVYAAAALSNSIQLFLASYVT